jgi:hypothetical protein
MLRSVARWTKLIANDVPAFGKVINHTMRGVSSGVNENQGLSSRFRSALVGFDERCLHDEMMTIVTSTQAVAKTAR